MPYNSLWIQFLYSDKNMPELQPGSPTHLNGIIHLFQTGQVLSKIWKDTCNIVAIYSYDSKLNSYSYYFVIIKL